jgi:molecular chaperone DnaK
VTARDVRTGHEQSVEVKPSYGLTDDQVEAMILESFDQADADFAERQVREARVEADSILMATDKARRGEAYSALSDEERAAIDKAVNELLVVYHHDDHMLIREKIEAVNIATQRLAETIMNTELRRTLQGTKL